MGSLEFSFLTSILPAVNSNLFLERIYIDMERDKSETWWLSRQVFENFSALVKAFMQWMWIVRYFKTFSLRLQKRERKVWYVPDKLFGTFKTFFALSNVISCRTALPFLAADYYKLFKQYYLLLCAEDSPFLKIHALLLEIQFLFFAISGNSDFSRCLCCLWNPSNCKGFSS